MLRVNSRLVTVLGLAGLLAAVGCGNKGPLYLPGPEAGQTAPPPEAAPPEPSGDAMDKADSNPKQ